MAMMVTMGATLQCTFGVAPVPLVITPENKVMDHSTPVATIMDFVPMKNIMPFGVCSAPTNPAVIAAMGSPVPCVPVIPAPWAPGSPTVMVGNKPALTNMSKAM